MNTFAKRSLSLLLALVMCLGMLSFAAAAVEVNYQTGNPSSKYTNVIKNWGERGVTATYLSPNAEKFYADNNVTYAQLAKLSGAANTSAVPSSALYAALQNLMASNHTAKTNYDETNEMYAYTDCESNDNGTITCFYCGKSINSTWDSAIWTKEHIWPKSKSLNGDRFVETNRRAETDITMLRPVCPGENSSRGDKAYGTVTGSSYYDPNLGDHNIHGDVARALLFDYVSWGITTNMWGTDGAIESKQTLIKWMREDPVDTWEMGRNDSVESITGTRNVFVDYPELAFALFNEDIPADLISPSGEGYRSSYTITAATANSAQGTVTLTGNVIAAYPAPGYHAVGYTVTSGSARVTQNGNIFTVTPNSNCTVRIEFSNRTPAAVSYVENGKTVKSEALFVGDSIKLPAHSGSVPKGFYFMGWVTESLTPTAVSPTARYAVDSSFTVNADTTFYALYLSITGDGTGTGMWTLVSDAGQLTAGTKLLIAYNAYGKVAGTLSSTYLTALDATFTDDFSNILEFSKDAAVFTLGGSTGKWTFTGSSGTLGSKGDKNLTFGSGSSTWNITIFNQNATIANTNTAYGCIEYNKQNPRFTTYKNTQLAPQLYALDGNTSTALYSTSTAACSHGNTTQVPAQAPTCTENGYTAGVYCNSCQSYLSGHGVVIATGHSYKGVVTPPTATQQGYTTYTCTACGNSYVGDYTDAAGEIFAVNFWVPDSVDNVAAMECGKSGITLPSADAPDGYTFAGWSAQPVGDTETAPTIYTAKSTYIATANTDLYAVYTYAAGNSGMAAYKLVTDAKQLKVGASVVIAAAKYNYALSMTQKSNNRDQASITKKDDTITFADSADVAILILEKGTTDGTWAFNTGSGYLYAASSSNNYLRTQTALDANGSFAISFNTDGTCGIVAQGTYRNNIMKYNATSKLFACYGASNTQKDLALYVLTEDGVTHYTSLGAVKAVAAAVYSGTNLVRECASFHAAVTACKNDQYIKLLSDIEVQVVLKADLYIDLNGFSFGGTVNTDGYTVYGMDSTTNSYNGDSVGYFTAVDYYTGRPIVPETHFKSDITGSVMRYMAVKSNAGYSFHRFYMGITHASVKPATVGVGYKAVFAGDDAVKAQIGSYGFELQLAGFDTVTATHTADSFVSGKTVSLRIEKYDVGKYGEAQLSAKVIMVLTDGTEIESAEVSMSLRDMVEKMNANYAAYTATQLTALKEMLDKFSITADWKTVNILS